MFSQTRASTPVHTGGSAVIARLPLALLWLEAVWCPLWHHQRYVYALIEKQHGQDGIGRNACVQAGLF